METAEMGPITAAMFDKDGPPSIIREWVATLEGSDNFVFLWAAATKGVSWSSFHTRLGRGLNEPNAVDTTPAANVERLLAPLAHEGRIKIMQALSGGTLTPSELTARTGFQGGGLYHHLKELKYASYISDKDGKYSLTPLGRQLLMTVTLMAKDAVVDRGEEGLAAGANWEKSTAEAEEESKRMVSELIARWGLSALSYTAFEIDIHSSHARDLQLEVTEVLGTSAKIAPGEAYAVRGRYTQEGERVAWLRLSAVGISQGIQARIGSGSGTFESTAEIDEVVAGRENVLDLTMTDEKGSDLGVRMRITLSAPV
jgi:DNA-binding HxlR family transcriptional regulator